MKDEIIQSDELILQFDVARMFLAEEEEEEACLVVSLSDITKRKQAEQALKESEEKYHLLIENQGEGMGVVDLDECFVFVNPAAERIFGVPPGSLKGRNLKDFVSAEQIPVILQETEKRSRAEKSTYEIDIIIPNGERHCLLVTATPQFNNKGILIGTYGIFRDITERKQTEEALLVKNWAVESTFNAIAIFGLEGNLSYVNSAFLSLWGYDSQSEILGKSITEFWLMGEKAAEIIKVLHARWNWNGELVGQGKNGNLFDIRIVASMVFNSNGQPICMQASFEDITKRKQAEEALRKSEQHYRLLYEQAVFGYYSLSIDGTILDVNHAALDTLAYSDKEKVVGRNFVDFITPEYKNMFREIFLKFIKQSYINDIQFDVLRGDGKIMHAYFEGRISYDKHGHFLQSHCIVSNIKNKDKDKDYYSESIALLTESAMKYVEIAHEENIYDYISEIFRKLTGAKYILINSFDKGVTELTVESFFAENTIIDKIQKVLGRSIVGMKVKPKDDITFARQHKDLCSKEIIQVHGGLYELSAESIPRSVCLAVEKMLNMGSVHLMGFSINNELYGSVSFILQKGEELKNENVVQAFINQTSAVLQRRFFEKIIRESDERYKQITETVGEWIWETDAQGLYTYSNPVVADIMGYTPAEIIGIKHFYDLFESKIIIELKKKIFAQLSDKKVLRNLVIEYIDKTGHSVFMQVNCLPILDKKGILLGIRGANNDISSLINTENALKETHTLLNALPEGIVMLDLNGRITEVSNITLEIMGDEDKANFIGKHFLRFIPPEEIKKVKEMQKRTVSEGLVQNIEVRLTKKNKSRFISEISSTLIQESGGKPKAFMAIIRDISQRKQMERKLIHTERMAGLGEMATGIAHEINQPLNTISLSLENIFLEIKTKKTIDEKYLQDKSDKVFENILRIGNIIDHIRAFSQDHDDYILTLFDINDSIKNAISMVSEQYKHKAIDIRISLDKKIQPILGNTYKFEQVILNLLTNAKDAVEEKKKTLIPHVQDRKVVNISTHQDDQVIYVEVKDNGIGIKASEIDKIMLPFYSTKKAGQGTGLGLSISFGIIKEMGGNIEIQSDPLIGTTMRIILPIVH